MLHRSRTEPFGAQPGPDSPKKWRTGPSVTEGPGTRPARVAFIIPARNEAGNIDAVLDSIFAQVGIEPEVVVIDNGSSDDTALRAANRGAHVVRCDGRVSDCRIEGVAASSAPTLFFVDADQRLDRDTAMRAVYELDDPRVTAVVIPERPLDPHTWWERVTGAERAIFEAAGRGIPRVFRRARYLEIGGHPRDVPFGEDYALLAKLNSDEISIADATIYHHEVAGPVALLKKYFSYGKRMAAASAPVDAIFTDRGGAFLALVARYALRSPFLAFAVLGTKLAKFAALRLGYAAGVLESPRCEEVALSRARLLALAGVATIVALAMNWRTIVTPGILIVGDHVSPRADYWQHILGAWDGFEHGGTANANLSDSPYFVLLGVLGRVLGAGIADKLLIVLFFVVAIVAATALLVRVLRAGVVPSFLLGVFYAFNPWTAARLAAGHTQILMGSALLPLIVLVWRRPTRRSALLAALGIAFELCLNLQVGLLAIVALFAFGRAGRTFWAGARDAALCAAIALGMNLWWVLPLLGTHGGNAGHTGLANVISYTQLTGLTHTATLRSYWWAAFSDGLYRYALPVNALVALGMAAIVAAEIAILLTWRCLSNVGRAGVALWLAVSLVLVTAHALPQAYWLALQLPFATLFRDPDKLVALSLFGLVVGCGDLASRIAWKRGMTVAACAAIACVTLPWWSSGNLRGDVAPQIVRDGSLEAAAWLANQPGNGLVLWWPDGPYVRYSWYPGGGQDPMRYWSSDPILNPYYDPAYDASPETSNFLYALEANLPERNVPYLGGVLGAYGIRYIAVRNYASTSFTDFPEYRPDFAAIRDLQRVETFGDTDVYQNLAWRPSRDVIGHYSAMLTGDFVPMLGLDPQLSVNEIVTGDGNPTAASYEYVDMERQLERGLVTYRYESNAPYSVLFSSGAQPQRTLENLPLTCAICDVLLVRSNALAPHIAVNGVPANPQLLYSDLPSWKPRWRAYLVGNATTISILTGDPNAYVYEAVAVTRKALDAAMLKSFDEVRHHWPTYIADAADLDLHRSGQRLTSDKLGPIVETDSRKWQALVIGSKLSSVDLTFYWWSGGERQRVVKLACTPESCSGAVTLNRGFQRVALDATPDETIQGFVFTSGRPPRFDNGRVDQIPASMDAATKLLIPASHNDGWHLTCANGTVDPQIGNSWASLYPMDRVLSNCALRYGPDAMERIGILLSALVLGIVAIALLAGGPLPKTQRRPTDPSVVETPGRP